jgi:hypothetical protein
MPTEATFGPNVAQGLANTAANQAQSALSNAQQSTPNFGETFGNFGQSLGMPGVSISNTTSNFGALTGPTTGISTTSGNPSIGFGNVSTAANVGESPAIGPAPTSTAPSSPTAPATATAPAQGTLGTGISGMAPGEGLSMDAGGALNFISPQNALLVAQYPWLAFQPTS